MRIHIKIQATNKVIPFDNQSFMVGTLQKWMGWNKEHGKVSLYSFSRLEMAKRNQNGLKFEQGSSFFFSAYNPDLIKQIVSGIQNDPDMFHGLKVQEIIIQENPDLTNKELFFVGSPIFIKRWTGEKVDHILYNDERASKCMVKTLQTKMKEAGIKDDSLEINFDKTYHRAGTKKITYHGIENRASWCPVIVKGKPGTKLFAWNVGIGFGAIK